MNFIFDNNLSAKLARGLNQFAQPDDTVKHLKDDFPGDAPDEQWMRELGSRPERWVVVTADTRIAKNPHEEKAWKEAGLAIFFLKAAWLRLEFWTQAQKLTKVFPEMIERAQRAKPGDSFQVTVNGKII